MATKFIINKGFSDTATVEGAESVRQVDGFFYFYDSNKQTVYIQNAGAVRHIQRIDG